jgi:outer membrane protein assembly factor BamB
MRRCLGAVAAAFALACSSAPGTTGNGAIQLPADGGMPDGGPPPPPLTGGGDWLQYRAEVRGTSSIDGTWTAAQVADLAPLWTVRVPDLIDGNPTVFGYTQPIVSADTVYLTLAFDARVVALDARNQKLRWSRSFPAEVTTTCGGTLHRGFWAAPALVAGVLYVAASDGHVYALDPNDGSVEWAVAVADPSAAGHGEFLQSSPAVSTSLGKLYVGVASSDHCDEVAGRIVSVDLATHTAQSAALVGPGQRGGGIWSSISIDERGAAVFASTANRIGDLSAEPNAQAIVKFDARTLAVVDRWQDPTTLENSDFGSSPTLFADLSGTSLVAAANKDGWLYVLRSDALSRGPVWKAQIAVIDPSQPTQGGDPSAGFGSIVSPTFANGLLYAAGGRTPSGDPGSVVAFDPTTGAVAWKHVTPGYVIAAMPAVGDLLVVESTSTDNQRSWLDVLDAHSGALLRQFAHNNATYAAPSVGRGLVLWVDAFGVLTVLASPSMHP